jgi:hypothetical protein
MTQKLILVRRAQQRQPTECGGCTIVGQPGRYVINETACLLAKALMVVHCAEYKKVLANKYKEAQGK